MPNFEMPSNDVQNNKEEEVPIADRDPKTLTPEQLEELRKKYPSSDDFVNKELERRKNENG